MKSLMYLDIETYSPVDLGTHGTRAYAQGGAQVLMIQLAVNDGPVELYEIDAESEDTSIEAGRRRLEHWINDPENHRFVIHGGFNFDLILLEQCLGVVIPPRMVIDTVNRARLHGYPGASLNALCGFLGVPDTLSKREGGRLIRLFCIGPTREHTRATHPADWELFRRYAIQDIRSLREVFKRLPKINCTPWEREVEIASQLMNARGIPIDIENARRIVTKLDQLKHSLTDRLTELSGGEVTSPGQKARLLKYLANRGIVLPDTQGDTLADFLEGPETPCTDLVEAFAEGNVTSTAKYQKILDLAVPDATGAYKIKDSLNYRGAVQTGRWSAKGFQPQNLPGRGIQDSTIVERILDSGEEPEKYWSFAKSALRQMIKAKPGKKLLIVDYAGIESRIQAVLANETAKIQCFRDFDAGIGPDSYILAYSEAFRVPIEEVTPFQRTIGKVMELALGYQGGPGAFLKMAQVNKIHLPTLIETVSLPGDVFQKVQDSYEHVKPDIPRDVYIACSGLVHLWRRRHSGIVSEWTRLQRELNTQDTADTRFVVELPSKRKLFYYGVQRSNEGQWTHVTRNEISNTLEHRGLYGGRIFQNMCQATSADILADVMVRLQDHLDHRRTSAELIFTVHDELVLQMDIAEDPWAFVLPEIKKAPSFLPGIPLNISWKSCNRYQK